MNQEQKHFVDIHKPMEALLHSASDHKGSCKANQAGKQKICNNFNFKIVYLT